MSKSLVIKNTNKCNLNCWFCSTKGNETMTVKQVEELCQRYANCENLIIGGEPMTLAPAYYLQLLNAGIEFSMQSNLTLYSPEWDAVLKHPGFRGLSVSGDKFEKYSQFQETYEWVCWVVGYKPPVLIIMDGNEKESRFKALFWAEAARQGCFPVKVNYLLPTGQARGKEGQILRVSQAFKIYAELFDRWAAVGGSYEIMPLTEIARAVAGEGHTCPFIEDCVRKDVMLDIEPDGSIWPCPVLGDLKATKAEIQPGLPTKCYTCDHFGMCRGCTVRNWMVRLQDDDEAYCAAATKLFVRIKEYVNGMVCCDKG